MGGLHEGREGREGLLDVRLGSNVNEGFGLIVPCLASRWDDI